MRAIQIAFLTLILTTCALGDVVILEANDIPLTGVILKDSPGEIEFQIKGLGKNSSFTISKNRIKRYWREESNHWEFRESEQAHEEAVQREEERRESENRPPDLKFEVPANAMSGRSNGEIRAALVARAVDRLTACVPDSLALQGVLALGGVLVLSLLIFIGGKVADLPSLTIKKSIVLSFMAGGAVVALIEILPKLGLPPGLLPAFILTLTLVWLVTARLLSRGRFMKGVIMLSFVLATLFVAGSSVFGILAVV